MEEPGQRPCVECGESATQKVVLSVDSALPVDSARKQTWVRVQAARPVSIPSYRPLTRYSSS